jgi:hypothetical protein
MQLFENNPLRNFIIERLFFHGHHWLVCGLTIEHLHRKGDDLAVLSGFPSKHLFARTRTPII